MKKVLMYTVISDFFGVVYNTFSLNIRKLDHNNNN